MDCEVGSLNRHFGLSTEFVVVQSGASWPGPNCQRIASGSAWACQRELGRAPSRRSRARSPPFAGDFIRPAGCAVCALVANPRTALTYLSGGESVWFLNFLRLIPAPGRLNLERLIPFVLGLQNLVGASWSAFDRLPTPRLQQVAIEIASGSFLPATVDGIDDLAIKAAHRVANPAIRQPGPAEIIGF